MNRKGILRHQIKSRVDQVSVDLFRGEWGERKEIVDSTCLSGGDTLDLTIAVRVVEKDGYVTTGRGVGL